MVSISALALADRCVGRTCSFDGGSREMAAAAAMFLPG
jgi:hypothetical protein